MGANSPYTDGGAFLGVAQYLASGPPNLTSDGYRNLQCDAAGNLCVNVRAGGGSGGSLGAVTIADPTTETNQAAVQLPGVSGAYALAIQGVLGGTPVPVSGTFSISGSTVTANAGTGFPTASAPGTPGTQLTTIQGSPSGTAVPVSGVFYQSTQPVSLATLPALTTGAATIGIVNAGIGFPSLTAAGTSGANLVTVQGSPTGVPQPVTGTFYQTVQPISATGLPLPTGAATSANQIVPGTAGVSSSQVISVQGIASGTAQDVRLNQGGNVPNVVNIGGDGNGSNTGLVTWAWPLIFNGTTWDRLRGVGGAVNTIVTGTAAISAASLPLPSGAATSALQPSLGTAGSPSANVITVQGITSMTPFKVDGSGVTQPVSAAALPLPTGAATSANQLVGGSAISATNPLPTTAGQFARTDKSGTITAGGTAQNAFATGNATHGFYFQNISTVAMYIRDDGTAASAGSGSILVPANGGYYESPPLSTPTSALSVFCATTASAYTCKVW
jgi:hypothetical protein